MLDPRTISRVEHGSTHHAGARFRCRVCRRFVKATQSGVCPSCGMPPPHFASVAGPTGPAAEEVARTLRRRLRWGVILLLEGAVLAALIYAALP